MSNNTRFAIAVHVLVLATVDGEEPVTSQRAADSVGTNPGFIRRLTSKLVEAGLVQVQMGKLGGMQLRKPAREISLLDIYHAVEPGTLLRMHASQPSESCFVGRNILGALEISVSDVERQFEEGLARIYLADVAEDVMRLAGRARSVHATASPTLVGRSAGSS